MKLNNIIILILTIIVLMLANLTLKNNSYILKTNLKEDVIVKHVNYENQFNTKINLKDIIEKEIRNNKELITMELDVAQKLQWNESWGKMKWLKKTQNIEFFGSGIYTTNLQNIKSNDITVDDVNKIILINVDKPSVKLVNLSEDKTIIGSVDKGFLRFGNVKMGIYESELLRSLAKDQMEEQLNSKENIGKAMEYTQIALQEIFLQILYAVGVLDYTINIEWK